MPAQSIPLSAGYSAWLLSPNRVPIYFIDKFVSLKYRLGLNSVGSMKMVLPQAFPLHLVQEDCILEIWRQVPGSSKQIDGDTGWLLRDWSRVSRNTRQLNVHLLGYSHNEILDRRHIDYPAGSSQSSKNGPADNVMKAYVREQLTTATDTTRNVTGWLTVASDTGQGITATKGAAYRRLLTVLREIAQFTLDEGSPVYFDCRYNPITGLTEFNTFNLFRGVNRGLTSQNPIVLSTKRGTLTEPLWQYVSSEERNRYIVGGGNTGSNRVVVRPQNDTRISVSPINLREDFYEKTDTVDTTALTNAGKTQLRKAQARTYFTAKIRESQDVRYQRDYQLGDVVVVEDEDFVGDGVIDSVEVEVSRDGQVIIPTFRIDGAL